VPLEHSDINKEAAGSGGEKQQVMAASLDKEETRRKKWETNQESHVSNRSNGTLSKLPQQFNPLGSRG
jgi:hypothetical protein